ncbi:MULTISPECIES: S8 family peptidase [Pantoea]|uniref:S8 family peptidase n=1 Tax=Pantoea TaxID=53335 RepID=UPI001FCC5A7D|nr:MULTISPECIES: S8 family peptidase [Pantoea]
MENTKQIMTEPAANRQRHIILPNTSNQEPFTTPPMGGISSPLVPERERHQHGNMLMGHLQQIKSFATQAKTIQNAAGLQSGVGIQVEFVGQPDVALAFESLSSEKGRDQAKRIELLSLHINENITSANVFIPDGKIVHFENYLNDYLTNRRRADNVSLDRRALINTLSAIRLSTIQSLWTDKPNLLPEDVEEAFWWEVWLPVRGNRAAVLADFHNVVIACQCSASEHTVEFPERTVTWMYGSQHAFSQSALLLNCVAELRRAKDTAEFFTGSTLTEQHLWADDALARIELPEYPDVPYVCLLDSGLNRAHPLLSQLVHENDVHTVNEAWGTDDRDNHGTGLAGIALYGDMFHALTEHETLAITHRLESVKLASMQGNDGIGGAHEHAYLFSEAVTRPEILSNRRRVFSSAVTATDYRDFGRPSAWSAMVDSLAADSGSEQPFPRLFVLSAGNIFDRGHWLTYPSSLSVNQIHDPGQAWNALTVGACTYKCTIDEADFQPLAPIGGLSPFTSTSTMWESVWPMKPDVVFEGGNAASNGEFADNFACLELLTTNAFHHRRLFATTNATSAASALAARMAAQLMAQFPNLRPETIRGLITHSARWTDQMIKMYPPVNQAGYAKLIRHCGWGVPDLELAIWSKNNSLALIEESKLFPYHRTSKGIRTREMNLHALPWPQDELLALQDMPVEMRVTLSYFIEPNPSARGSASKFYYPSHRLRFAMKRPTEQLDEFRMRINAAAETEDGISAVSGSDSNWQLGSRYRHKGSLHQDIWRGTAAELANCGYLAVLPGQGWWKTRQALERYNSEARYSIIVSIHTPNTHIDLLTPTRVKAEALVENNIEITS